MPPTDGALGLARTAVAGNRADRNPCRHLHAGGHLPRHDRQARSSRGEPASPRWRLMPLADFAGQRNWGYDGVLWYAPDSAYGRPEDLKALIDAAHLRGLMVFLDVVYNHFGPEGNYLGRYAPALLHRAQTPWGSAIDYRVPEVRALRHRECAVLAARIPFRRAAAGCGACHHRTRRSLDAARTEPCRRQSRRENRPAHSSGARETTTTPRSLLDAGEVRRAANTARSGTTIIHHAWHVLLTGETHGYYRDYPKSPLHDIARAWRRASSIRAKRRASRRASAASPAATFPDRLRQLPAEPRPDRQPRARRPARKRAPHPRRSRPRWRSRCWRRECRCCSWARNGARSRPSRSSAISRAISPKPFARGGRREFAGAYAKYGDEVPDPLAQIDLPIRGA